LPVALATKLIHLGLDPAEVASEAPAKGKKPHKASAGQKEMLLPIEGKKPAAKKAAKPDRSAGRRKAG
jgi:DNA end-binding protein Ku